MYRVGFIVEQALGHVTHGMNLQEFVPLDAEIEAYWSLPAWQPVGLASKIPFYRSNWTLRAGLQARKAVAGIQRQTRLDALFFHTQVTAVLSRDWLKRIPGIVSLDATPRQIDSFGDAYQHASGPAWLERWKWRLNRDCFRSARHLVTWSEWTKNGLAAEYGVPAGKITVIPPGVDVKAWEALGQQRRSDGPVKILFVGGNFQRKGGSVLLEAFRGLRQSLPAGLQVELHLVTRDAISPEQDVFVQNNLNPNSPALRQLYSESHIFCLPTLGDIFPMALSEAGAAGLPIISTRLAGIPELVRDGEVGFLAAPGDVTALQGALQCLVENPALRVQQGQAALRLVRQEFDCRKNTIRLLDLIKQVAGEEKGRKMV